MRSLLVGLLGPVLTSPAWALGYTVSYEEATAHLGGLQQIQRCGEWKDGERFGEYRLLHFWMYGQDLLYVDRVPYGIDVRVLDVDRAYVFDEIDNDHAELSLTELRCSTDGGHYVEITGVATSGHDDSVTDFHLRLDGASGQYRYETKP